MTHGPLSWRELVERDKQKSEDARGQIKRAAMQPTPRPQEAVMQSELNVFVELADTWETIEGNSDQRAVYRECADGLRMMVDFKRQQIDTSLQPDRAPTHRCTVCGAFWMEWKDSWSLCSKQCGQCCDNVAMGDQIVPLIVSDIYAPAAEITRLTEALRAAEERERVLREALEPFAKCCEDWISDDEDDEEWAKFRLLIKDYRRASVAMKEQGHGG